MNSPNATEISEEFRNKPVSTALGGVVVVGLAVTVEPVLGQKKTKQGRLGNLNQIQRNVS